MDSTSPSPSEYAQDAIRGVALIAVTLAVAEVLSVIWPNFALLIYGAYVLVSLIVAVGILWYFPRVTAELMIDQIWAETRGIFRHAHDLEFQEEHRRKRIERVFPFVVVVLADILGFVVAYSEFLRRWFLAFGGFMVDGSSYWDFLKYGASWCVDNVVGNVSQIYGIQISSIHATSFAARTLVFGFNLAFEFVAVGVIVQTFRALRVYQLR